MEKGRVHMLSDTVRLGDKIKIFFNDGEENREKKASYNSRIVEIMDSNRIKASMPIINGKYVVLDSLKPYNIEFITKKGMYGCQARIVRRFKEKMKSWKNFRGENFIVLNVYLTLNSDVHLMVIYMKKMMRKTKKLQQKL